MEPSARAKLVSCSGTERRRPGTATTSSPAGRQPRGLGAGGGGLEGELNEIADFFDEGAELLARGTLSGAAQLLRARQCAVTAIEQCADGDHRQLDRRGRARRSGWRPGRLERRR